MEERGLPKVLQQLEVPDLLTRRLQVLLQWEPKGFLCVCVCPGPVSPLGRGYPLQVAGQTEGALGLGFSLDVSRSNSVSNLSYLLAP